MRSRGKREKAGGMREEWAGGSGAREELGGEGRREKAWGTREELGGRRQG